MSSIFIQIAAYNDKELSRTVEDCIEKSSKKHDLFFGIHECYINNKTKIDFNNVKIEYSKAPENIGVGVGRYIANKFYNDEDYYFQIDSHSRFAENWDQILIDDLNNNLNKFLCVLTTYPARYWYENGKEVFENSEHCSSIKLLANDNFKEYRILHQESAENIGQGCADSVSAAFIFGPGNIAKIEQNPAVFFWGEEILKAASLYTNGYNLIMPKQNVLFHLYGVESERIPVWETFKEESEKKENFSKIAIRTIFSQNLQGKRDLGNKRDIGQYGKYLGLDFINGIIL